MDARHKFLKLYEGVRNYQEDDSSQWHIKRAQGFILICLILLNLQRAPTIAFRT